MRKEQMTIVLRYKYRKGFVIERLIYIFYVQDIGVLSLKRAIVNLLDQYSWVYQMCVGNVMIVQTICDVRLMALKCWLGKKVD